MIYQIYAVRDDKSDLFMEPFTMPAHGAAVRAMMDLVANPEHIFGRHAEDYTLWAIGEFNASTGHIDADPDKFEKLGCLAHYRKEPSK